MVSAQVKGPVPKSGERMIAVILRSRTIDGVEVHDVSLSGFADLIGTGRLSACVRSGDDYLTDSVALAEHVLPGDYLVVDCMARFGWWARRESAGLAVISHYRTYCFKDVPYQAYVDCDDCYLLPRAVDKARRLFVAGAKFVAQGSGFGHDYEVWCVVDDVALDLDAVSQVDVFDISVQSLDCLMRGDNLFVHDAYDSFEHRHVPLVSHPWFCEHWLDVADLRQVGVVGAGDVLVVSRPSSEIGGMTVFVECNYNATPWYSGNDLLRDARCWIAFNMKDRDVINSIFYRDYEIWRVVDNPAVVYDADLLTDEDWALGRFEHAVVCRG